MGPLGVVGPLRSSGVVGVSGTAEVVGPSGSLEVTGYSRVVRTSRSPDVCGSYGVIGFSGS